MKLGHKVLALTVSGSAITSLLLVGIVYLRHEALEETVRVDIDAKARAECSRIAENFTNLMGIVDEMGKNQVRAGINGLVRDVNTRGVAFDTETVTWEVTNQETKAKQTLALPKMMIGGAWLGQNRDPKQPSTFDAAMLDIDGGLVTIFQRMNEAGDMLRVSTNVTDSTGNRAIGTYIPATAADGTANAVVATLLHGDRYVGRALVCDKWCVTAYDPIVDKDKNVIGAVFCGIPQKAFQSVSQLVMGTKVGLNGYVFVLQGKGKNRGTYIISAKGLRDGENVWETKDADGNPIIQKIINTATAQAAGQPTIVEYPWKNNDELTAREKVAAVAYFAPWDWVIGVSAYKEDFRAAEAAVKSELDRLMIVCTITGIVVTSILAAVAAYATKMITRPLLEVSHSLEEIAQGDGDLSRRLDDSTKDETGELAHWFNVFVEKIQTIMARIATTANELNSVSTDLFSTSKQLTEGAEQTSHQSASVAAAAEEVSTTMNGMTDTSKGMAESINSAAAAVEELRASISSLAGNAESAAGVAEKAAGFVETSHTTIGRLSEAANEIGNVVELIQKIAEQTNLLALNATIEAARAGDSGKGFAVVATEVKELARQTRQATDDIRNRIEGIQVSSNETVGAMGNIRDTIEQVKQVSRTIAAAVHEQSTATQEIAESVTRTSSAALSFTSGLSNSTDASKDIARNITDVDQGARATLTVATRAEHTGDNLARLAQQMQELVGRFNA